MNKIERLTYMLGACWILTGCAVTKWLVENEQAIEAGGDVAEATGPYGVIASLVMTNVVSAAKWYENKKTTKDLIATVQKSKEEMTPQAKALLVEKLDKHMPEKIKKVVSKVKAKL